MKLWIPFAVGVLLLLGSICPAQDGIDWLGDPLPDGAVQRLGTMRMMYPGGLSDIGYLPDGRAIVSVGTSIHIWNLEHGERESTYRISDSALGSMKTSRDGNRLLFVTGGDVLEWSIETQEQLHRFPTGQASLTSVAYSPDETRVVTVGQTPTTLKEFELATGQERISIQGQFDVFHAVVYGPEGTTAFVVGGFAPPKNNLVHYDLQTGEKLHECLQNYRAYNLLLSPDGERLLVASRSMATEWRIDGYEQLQRFTGHHGGQVTALAYCAEPDQVLTGSRDGSIRHWNRETGEIILRWFPHPSRVSNIAVSPDGQRVLSYGAGILAESILDTGRARLDWERHAGSVEAVAAVPGTRQVVSGSSDGTLRIWDALSGENLRTITGAELGAYCVAISPDGVTAAAGCKDGMVREFRLSDGELIRDLEGHLGYVHSVAYIGDGRLISSADDGTVRVWAANQEEAVAVLQGHLGGVLALDVSADHQRVISGGRDGTVRLWELASGSQLAQLEGHRGWVETVAFVDPDGSRAVSGGADGRIIHWNTQAKEAVGGMEHGSWLRDLAVSADGSTVYSAADDRAICVWKLATGERTGHFTGHQAAINDLALCDDGLLVSASSDTSLLVWPVQ